METTKGLTVREIAELDKENRQLMGAYSTARIKIGLELAKRLKLFDDERLYSKLDEDSYPTFNTYLQSLGINYKSAREIIGLYETYVIAAGLSIDELVDIGYHKLTTIKPMLFEKEQGEYKLTKPRAELKKWIADAKSDITQEDLMQKRREREVGEHEHQFKEVKYRVCEVCKLKEFFG